jgi:chromosome transmission fidelity protein 18
MFCLPDLPFLILSDARSGSTVDDRIRPALESGRAIGSDKPVLVIIDEIDGATGESVSRTAWQ